MNYTLVQKHIDHGRGKEGQILGPPCTIYRLGLNPAATNYLDASNVYLSNVRILYINTAKKDDLETPEHMGTLFYDTKVDMTRMQLQVGDIAVVNDNVYGIGSSIVMGSYTTQFSAMCLCGHMPLKTVISARIDRVCWIYRPTIADSTGDWNESPPASLALVMSNGLYSFAAPGTAPTSVPLGLATHTRVFSKEFKDVPGSTGFSHYFGYIPPLPGVYLRDGDWLVTDATASASGLLRGTRYVVITPWIQEEAVVGYQLVLERETDQS